MTYFFILGNNPTLSIAEIISVVSEDIDKIQEISSEFLILKTKKSLDADDLQKRLGGTIKIGQIIGKTELDASDLAEKIIEILPRGFKKIYFGFSVYPVRSLKIYGGSNPPREFKNKKIEERIKTVALGIKKNLREKGISSRWVSSKQQVLSSVIVKKNKLLNQGAEIVLLIGKNEVFLGKTLSCQEFEEYSFYDFARPFRVIEKGMLPPKLAKIMINLSSCSPRQGRDKVLLDPFCGSGTILQQAVLMGYRNVIGTDKSKEAVVYSQKNLNWLVEKRKTRDNRPEIQVNIKIFQCDVREISEKLSVNSVDFVVTEPYLGPLRITSDNQQSIIENLSGLYVSAFKELKKVLKPGGTMVVVFPVYNKLHFLPILEELKKIGWRRQSLLPDFLLKNKVINITDRQSVIYSRPNQVVLREILIFK